MERRNIPDNIYTDHPIPNKKYNNIESKIKEEPKVRNPIIKHFMNESFKSSDDKSEDMPSIDPINNNTEECIEEDKDLPIFEKIRMYLFNKYHDEEDPIVFDNNRIECIINTYKEYSYCKRNHNCIGCMDNVGHNFIHMTLVQTKEIFILCNNFSDYDKNESVKSVEHYLSDLVALLTHNINLYKCTYAENIINFSECLNGLSLNTIEELYKQYKKSIERIINELDRLINYLTYNCYTYKPYDEMPSSDLIFGLTSTTTTVLAMVLQLFTHICNNILNNIVLDNDDKKEKIRKRMTGNLDHIQELVYDKIQYYRDLGVIIHSPDL